MKSKQLSRALAVASSAFAALAIAAPLAQATTPAPGFGQFAGCPSGKSPEFKEEPSGILAFRNGTYVDNSFAAPGASGCVLTLFGFLPINLNPLVNAQSGLPAAAGSNETVQNIDIELAASELVYP